MERTIQNMPLPTKALDQGYSAVFVAQKKSRGAYGKKHLVDMTNYKELSVQNYAALTAERLQREKELDRNCKASTTSTTTCKKRKSRGNRKG